MKHKLMIAVMLTMETHVLDIIPKDGETEQDAKDDAKELANGKENVDFKEQFDIDTCTIMMRGKGVFPRSFGDKVEKEFRRLLVEEGYCKDDEHFREVGHG